MARIGIMGGTFNPIHYGHLLIAENAREQMKLDRVHFIPTGRSPHKQGMEILEGEQRLQMVRLAIADQPAFYADDRELRQEEVSYSYLTIQRMREEYPMDELFFILGGDSLKDFRTWYHPEIICSHACIIAAVRDKLGREQLEEYAKELKQLFSAKVYLIQTPNLSVSSSELRKRVAAGHSIRYQVPDRVIDYIDRQHLYTKEL